jgi:hypothetical protein
MAGSYRGGRGSVDGIDLAQDRDKLRDFVNVLTDPLNAELNPICWHY